MIPKVTQDKLNAIAEARAKELYTRAYDILTQDEYTNKGELADSLKITWFRATDVNPPRILLTYKLQGFILGLKKMSWVKVPNLQKLKDWGEAINFSGPIPGYKGSADNLPPWKRQERILNAIAFDKRKNETWKQKPWKGKRGMKIGELISEINTETKLTWKNDVEQILSESIATGKILS
jgi:hypothetical protein